MNFTPKRDFQAYHNFQASNVPGKDHLKLHRKNCKQKKNPTTETFPSILTKPGNAKHSKWKKSQICFEIDFFYFLTEKVFHFAWNLFAACNRKNVLKV